MEELKRLLLQADDEYLAGLSNKGTVKRAYKDLEQEKPSARWDGEEAEVAWKEASCRVRAPLGDSSCSCPSRSVCRHLIGAILYLKKELEAEGQKEQKTGVGELPEDPFPQQRKEPENKKGELQPDLEQALLAVPMARLRQALKARGLREFLAHAEAGGRPGLEAGASGTVLTVRFPWNERIVKLLCPLEHSSCTCHSRELCVHKAQAVLAFQLQKGAVTLEELKTMDSAAPDWDLEELSQAARQMKEGIRLQLLTGLSRLSPEAEEAMERLAVISHGAGLADFETELRAAASEYRQYFRRSGAFRTEDLLGRLLALYRKASLLERTKEPETIRELAGTFRDAYHPVPRLHLTAIGGRSFKSKAGYEGERYYFLETEQKRWYTWTDARPVFYEGRRRPSGNSEQEAAPWGLGCSRAAMLELEFYLTQAKAAGDGRLSVSKETKSEIAGQRNLGQEAVRAQIVWDYRKLLSLLEGEAEDAGERLALAGAFRCGKGSFDSVRQRFEMDLFDRNGRRISLAVKYSAEEKLTIQVLERLSARLAGQKDGQTPLVFFGIPYLEGGRLCLYPIEFFEWGRFGSPSELPEAETEAEDGMEAARPKSDSSFSMEAVYTLEQLLLELRQLLTDLFQSGLSSVQEGSLSELHRLEKESEELGLHGASEGLAALGRDLEGKRHRMKYDPEAGIEIWGKLMEYVRTCLKKASYDQALLSMESSADCIYRK